MAPKRTSGLSSHSRLEPGLKAPGLLSRLSCPCSLGLATITDFSFWNGSQQRSQSGLVCLVKLRSSSSSCLSCVFPVCAEPTGPRGCNESWRVWGAWFQDLFNRVKEVWSELCGFESLTSGCRLWTHYFECVYVAT